MNRTIAALIALLFAIAAEAEELRMAVTTSFNNSGLSDVLLPHIKSDLDLDVRLIVVGTGQALKLGAAGDVDAVLVHSRKAEEAFIADGNAPHRREVMFNDFVIIGPSEDPAGVSTVGSASEAFKAIAEHEASFVSRGDDSGTHKKEGTLWRGLNIIPSGRWYRPVGAGMGAALNTASAMNAYIFADRPSWLKFGNKKHLKLLFSGDPVLFNQYAFLPVSVDKHGHVNAAAAARLETWLAGDRAKALIDSYRLNGERLFTHNARSPAN